MLSRELSDVRYEQSEEKIYSAFYTLVIGVEIKNHGLGENRILTADHSSLSAP
jgi:hypothetical protein